jgi:O-glycosyl hydrolase
MKFIHCLNALLFTVFLNNNAQETTIRIFPEVQFQKIKSIGANYCQVRLTNDAWDSIGEETLKQFRPENVRVAVPLKVRGADYENYKGNKLVEQPLVISLLKFMKQMKTDYGVKSFTVSTWDVPDELVVDPSVGRARVIKPESYDAVIDLITAFLNAAKDEYGVEVDYFSFNESEKGIAVIFSPWATIDFIKKACSRFESEGLKTKFLLSDASTPKVGREFATLILADSTIWKYLGPLSFHSWGAEKMPDAEFERVAALGKAIDRPVWCTELGHDGWAHKDKTVFETWDYAIRFARITQRILKYTQAEVTMYWTWQNDYPIMSPDLKTLYPSYYATRHFTDFLNTGTQIVHSVSSDPEVLVISGIHQDGSKVVQMINMRKEPVKVNIPGMGFKSAEMITTSDENNWEKTDFGSKKVLTDISLKPESINTLLLK